MEYYDKGSPEEQTEIERVSILLKELDGKDRLTCEEINLLGASIDFLTAAGALNELGQFNSPKQ